MINRTSEILQVVDTETSPAARAPPAPRSACVAVGTLTAAHAPDQTPQTPRKPAYATGVLVLPDGQEGPTYGHMDNLAG